MRSSLLLFGACLFLAVAGSLMAGGSKQQNQMGMPMGPSLDYEYFKTRVEPIFLAKRPGHARCVTCHSSNSAALRLVPLSPGAASWSDEESRKNFDLIKRVARPGDPSSPLLIHPLAEDAGGDMFHSGGKHFSSQSDPEWMVLKEFVMGKKAGE